MAAWKKTLSSLAFKKLRFAQHAKRRQMLRAVEQLRNIEMSNEGGRITTVAADPQLPVIPVTTAATVYGNVTQQPYNGQLQDSQNSFGYVPTSFQYPPSHSTSITKTRAVGETDSDMLDNTVNLTQGATSLTSKAADEAEIYALPTQYTITVERPSIHEADALLSSSPYFLRAATLGSNTADGAAVYPPPAPHGSMTERILGYDTIPFLNPDPGVLRAATLGSNTADGTGVYPSLSRHGTMVEVISGYDTAPFPTPGVDFLRAATLGSHTADGVTAYFSLDQRACVEEASLSQDDLFFGQYGAPTK
ncbi:hypothetical protein S7711_10781 [Stachybotrys chartarum IBT 7711]|uniref:Uncharacterized protein n=1 Tax=Stachybotrys chartarum (strain CBS 109288 / IBT 7711) TaxID=1280523 RepID=A0A084AHT3_STACB|nr:hypothetical protein S7711_10781 [Stachybotrys chartarum IBT 7711]